MKTIGIIGGMSPESTVLYYQIINRETNRRLGGNRSAKILLDSVDFEESSVCRKAAIGRRRETCWHKAREAGSGRRGFLLLATNTMHKVAPAIEQAAGIPLLHVVDATAAAIKRQGLSAVGLLGTRFTMSDGFYTERMVSQGVQTIAPTAAEQDEIHRIIFDELCLNRIRPESARYFYDVIGRLKNEGAQGVILGCTEICLLVNETDSPLPVFDSTAIHALAAVDAALAE